MVKFFLNNAITMSMQNVYVNMQIYFLNYKIFFFIFFINYFQKAEYNIFFDLL